jgi:hypothetical protein
MKEMYNEEERNGSSERYKYWPDKKVAHWLHQQRYLYRQKQDGKENSLTDEREQKLLDLGVMKAWERQWMQWYERLQMFVKERECFPHECEKESLTKEDAKLDAWCNNQRKHYHIYNKGLRGQYTPMTKERQEKLVDIGFCFDLLEKFWIDRYGELQAYRKQYGDCLVPAEYKANPQLGTWVGHQRENYKKIQQGLPRPSNTSMTEERQQKLEDIGFCFDLFEKFWMDRYGELQEYHEHHGDCLVPKLYKANPQLGKWVGLQRNNYKTFREGLPRPGFMTTERIDLLNKLDFVWSVPDFIWNEKYILLEEHVRMNGLGSIPSWKHNLSLRTWAANQQKLYWSRLIKENSMTKERIQKLDRLGFPWAT